MSDADRSGRPPRWRHPATAIAVPVLVLGLVAVLPTLTLLGTDPCVGEDPTGCASVRESAPGSAGGPVLSGRGGDAAPSAVPSAAPSAGPGGAMPGSRPGWKVNFADDFTGRGIDLTRWGRYSGRPGGAPPTAEWQRGNVLVRDGKLLLKGRKIKGKWVTAGVSMAPAGARTYGRWDIRFRIQRGNGVGYAILLYPGDGGWPPEIDIAEDGGGLRTTTQATLHWGEENHQIQRTTSSDFTVWHTVGVIWEPGRVRYLLDDREWGRVDSPDVPDEPMWLGLQTQQSPCVTRYRNCPLPGETTAVDMEVDWVVRSERSTAGSSLPGESIPGLSDESSTTNSTEEPGATSSTRSAVISAEGLIRRRGTRAMGWT
jgi:beta-glucanase (GH16 family)